MSCFPCFRSQRSKKDRDDVPPHGKPELPEVNKPRPAGHQNTKSEENIDHGSIKSKNFTFRELATATKNFRRECLLGEGGFGRVYRGTLPGSGQVVAVKQLDRNGMQGNKEFIAEVSTLSLLNHENLVNLIGYCADGDQRLLVYEYIPGGPVENHLLDIGPDRKPLDWITRMKIACGVAQGLEYLHDKADPPVIYRDLKSSNVLLDENLNPKLSDFGLTKLGPQGDKFHVTPRVMGTYGYCAPEYTRTGDLTIKSNVYSFGVVLLELITGRRAMDTTKPNDEQNLVAWARPKFRDPKLFPEMADSLLQKKFPEKALNQVVALTAMCLQEEASVRPLMSDVVATLSFLLTVPQDPASARPDPSPASDEAARKSDVHSDHGDSSEDEGDAEGSETSDDESTEGGKEGGSVQKAASSRHKKGGSSRRMSRKESAASANRNNSTRLSEEGSISSSSSHGSISSGHWNSKRSIASSGHQSSHGKFDSSLSWGHSKVYISIHSDLNLAVLLNTRPIRTAGAAPRVEAAATGYRPGRRAVSSRATTMLEDLTRRRTTTRVIPSLQAGAAARGNPMTTRTMSTRDYRENFTSSAPLPTMMTMSRSERDFVLVRCRIWATSGYKEDSLIQPDSGLGSDCRRIRSRSRAQARIDEETPTLCWNRAPIDDGFKDKQV